MAKRKRNNAIRKKQKPRLAEVLRQAGGKAPIIADKNGAGNETRTRDPDLGKVVLYQLSYSRASPPSYDLGGVCQPLASDFASIVRAIRASFSRQIALIQSWKRARNAASFS
jgi:hypothetical protein